MFDQKSIRELFYEETPTVMDSQEVRPAGMHIEPPPNTRRIEQQIRSFDADGH